MKKEIIECNVSNYLERIELESELIEAVVNILRPQLPNPNIQLFMDVSEPIHYGAATIMAANASYIVVFLSALDGGILYSIEKYFGHYVFKRMTDDELNICLNIITAVTVVSAIHECIHICQNIDTNLVNYRPYNDVIEEDAIMRSHELAKKLLPQISDDIWDNVIKTGYAKGLLYTMKDLPGLAGDLHRYYLMTIRGSVMCLYFNTDKLDNLLAYTNDIVILNQLNGRDEIIYIKFNGVFNTPTEEYTRLISMMKLDPAGVYDRMKKLDISLDYEYIEIDDILNVSIRLTGEYLLPGLIKDTYQYYGIASIYEEREDTLNGLLLE